MQSRATLAASSRTSRRAVRLLVILALAASALVPLAAPAHAAPLATMDVGGSGGACTGWHNNNLAASGFTRMGGYSSLANNSAKGTCTIVVPAGPAQTLYVYGFEYWGGSQGRYQLNGGSLVAMPGNGQNTQLLATIPLVSGTNTLIFSAVDAFEIGIDYLSFTQAAYPCDDGDVTGAGGSWGGGGAWEGPEGASNSGGGFGEIFWKIDQALTGGTAIWLETFGMDVPGWFDDPEFIQPDGQVVSGTDVGFGGYGGGGTWGVACDADNDHVPDTPAGASAPVIQTITPPPAQSPTPSGACDFGITDPSSWLCSLGGLFGQLLDIIRAILSWLTGLGQWLLGLLTPTPGHFTAEFGTVQDAWDGTAPVVVVNGLTDVLEPVTTIDTTRGSCQGPLVSLPMLIGDDFALHPFDACNELIQMVWHGQGLPAGVGGIDLLAFAIYFGALMGGARFLARKLGTDDAVAEPA